jgi:hypothetical protein
MPQDDDIMEVEAKRLKAGDEVIVAGLRYRIMAVRTGGIAAPLFRLAAVDHDRREIGWTSYKLCSPAS